MPSRLALRERWFLRPFDALLHDPALLATHRKGVVRAFAIGLFLAWMPIPAQMAAAALVALWVRCNLPVAMATVWLSNPVTVGPMFYSAYRLGALILDVPVAPGFTVELSLAWWLESLARWWQPLLLGSLLLGLATASAGYLSLNILWAWSAGKRWRLRRTLRQSLGRFRR